MKWENTIGSIGAIVVLASIWYCASLYQQQTALVNTSGSGSAMAVGERLTLDAATINRHNTSQGCWLIILFLTGVKMGERQRESL